MSRSSPSASPCCRRGHLSRLPRGHRSRPRCPPPHSGHADARLRRDARGRDGGICEELAVGISGAGQAEQATRQRWPPPAPRLRRLLRCHPAGWQSGPGWIVHRCYSGPWRPRRGHHRDLDRSSELLLVVKGQIGPPALAHDPGPHHGPLRQRRSTTYSASSATATRRKYSTTRSSTVLIVAARKSMTCVLAFDAGRPGPIGGVGPVSSRSAPTARQSSAFTLR
jgi:hypothetical protein